MVPTRLARARDWGACSRSPIPRSPRFAICATAHDGCAEVLMMAHGFTVEQMVELLRAGLATATAERVVAGSRKIEVACASRRWDGGRF